MKSLKTIKDEALKAFTKLEKTYIKEYQELRIDYLYHLLINDLMNHIKALEYHFRDDIHKATKRSEWKRANRFLKKYAGQCIKDDVYSRLMLKRKYIPRDYGDGYKEKSV